MRIKTFKNWRKKGTLLFETFVALMVLSIGITGSMRVFSEALYVGRKNADRTDVQSGLDRWLFESFALPGSRIKLDDHLQPYYFRSDDGRQYQYGLTLHPLSVPHLDEQKEKQTQLSPIPEREYRKVDVQVTDDQGKKVAEFETVLFAKVGNQ